MRRALAALALWLCLGGAAAAQLGNVAPPTVCSGDINAACSQVTSQHLSAPLPPAAGGTGTASGFAAGDQRVLCSIRGVALNVTTDQACAIAASVTTWAPIAIWMTNCSGTPVLAAGGVYPAASKAGTPLVAATQVYTALNASSVILPLTLAAGIVTTRMTAASVFLSLTTANAASVTCDFYLIGVDLS